MTRLLLISGSLRRDSFNTRLLHHVSRHLVGHCTVDFLDPSEVSLPLFDQDLELTPTVVKQVADLHRRIAGSDGLIVSSPEYNGQLPPYLKNLVDWVSRMGYIDASFGNAFCDRPVLLCSASTGWSGGSGAIPSARALFGYVGALVIGDTVCVPYAQQGWTDEAGFLFDQPFEDRISAACQRVLALVNSNHHPFK